MSIDIYVCWTVERRPTKGRLDMRVTKAQAEQNRAHIVATASRLFRERGYDGVGVAELMAAAGFTHGGFYKHFRSKADLMAEASASGLSQTVARTEGLDPAEFVERYVSREHRDGRGDGCTIAALGGDAARQPADIKTEFAAGIENLLTALQSPKRYAGGCGPARDPHDDRHARPFGRRDHVVAGMPGRFSAGGRNPRCLPQGDSRVTGTGQQRPAGGKESRNLTAADRRKPSSVP